MVSGFDVWQEAVDDHAALVEAARTGDAARVAVMLWIEHEPDGTGGGMMTKEGGGAAEEEARGQEDQGRAVDGHDDGGVCRAGETQCLSCSPSCLPDGPPGSSHAARSARNWM